MGEFCGVGGCVWMQPCFGAIGRWALPIPIFNTHHNFCSNKHIPLQLSNAINFIVYYYCYYYSIALSLLSLIDNCILDFLPPFLSIQKLIFLSILSLSFRETLNFPWWWKTSISSSIFPRRMISNSSYPNTDKVELSCMPIYLSVIVYFSYFIGQYTKA